MFFILAALAGAAVWAVLGLRVQAFSFRPSWPKLPFLSNLSKSRKWFKGTDHSSFLPVNREIATDYTKMKLSMLQRTGSIAVAAAVLFGIGYLFYKHTAVALAFSVLGCFYPKSYRKILIRKRKEALSGQFKQALYSISSSLSAGKSIENAFRDAANDLHMLYRDSGAYIVIELERICRKVENGETIEHALLDFSRRADLEEVRHFSDVFVTCKRSGGNLMQVARRTSAMIGEKMELQQEIAVMLAQKRFESKILVCAPAVVIAVLRFSSADYMMPLYGSPTGVFVMSAALVLLACAWAAAGKLMNIKV